MDTLRHGDIVKLLVVSSLLIIPVLLEPTRVDYSGHKVLRVYTRTQRQVNCLHNLTTAANLQIEQLTELSVARSTDLRVAPGALARVLQLFKKNNITYTTMIDNLGRLIQSQESSIRHRPRRDVRTRHQGYAQARRQTFSQSRDGSKFHWFNIVGTYPRFNEIHRWLGYAQAAYPHLAEVRDIGLSFENRTLRLIKLGRADRLGRSKPVIWIDAGMHAREWVSPATAVYFIYRLLTRYGRDAYITELLNDFDWYIYPLANPDGYEHSFIYDRMWRKTRSGDVYDHCRGVDMNRNFDYHWMDCEPSAVNRCASANPCHSIYAGPRPESEPETRALVAQLRGLRRRMRMYLSLHSYSQMWLTPWGHTKTLPRDYDAMVNLARIGTAAIWETFRTKYTIGTPAQILYPAGGGSFDWVKAKLRTQYSYTVELRDRGRYGFMLPRTLIIPTAHEVFNGVRAMVQSLGSGQGGRRRAPPSRKHRRRKHRTA